MYFELLPLLSYRFFIIKLILQNIFNEFIDFLNLLLFLLDM